MSVRVRTMQAPPDASGHSALLDRTGTLVRVLKGVARVLLPALSEFQFMDAHASNQLFALCSNQLFVKGRAQSTYERVLVILPPYLHSQSLATHVACDN